MKLNGNHFTKHHIISQCKDRYYNINKRCNIKYVKWRRHKGLHALFVSHEPKDQLRELYKIYKGVLSKEAKKRFLSLLDTPVFYKTELYK